MVGRISTARARALLEAATPEEWEGAGYLSQAICLAADLIEARDRVEVIEAENAAVRAEIKEIFAMNVRMRNALAKIANGDGVYGAQALEYKTIARAALAIIAQEGGDA
jgi:hypothetical protein